MKTVNTLQAKKVALSSIRWAESQNPSDKRRVLTKTFVESQFGYCPLIWINHSRTLNDKISRLHERA